jgi:hypothetical protein
LLRPWVIGGAAIAGAVVDVVFDYHLAKRRRYDATTHLLKGAYNGAVFVTMAGVVLWLLMRLRGVRRKGSQ